MGNISLFSTTLGPFNTSKGVLSTLLLTGIVTSSFAAPVLAIEAHAYRHYQDAILLERQGKLPQAEEQLRFSIAKDPFDTLNYLKLASVLAQQGKTHEAVSLLQKAASMDSQDSMIYFTLGSLYEEQAEFPKAEEAYRRALVKNKLYRYGYFNLARVQTQLTKYPDAIDSYRKFLEKYPDNFDARSHLARLLLVTDDVKASAGEFERLKLEHPKRFHDHVYYAKALNKSNDSPRALAELKEAFTQEGDKADIAEEMGNTHVALGQYIFAIANYQKALKLDPTNDELLPILGDLHLKVQQPDNAIKDFKTYLAKHPDAIDIRKSLAFTLVAQKQYGPGLQELTRLETDETRPEERRKISKEIAFAYQMSGNLDKAIDKYTQLITDPELSGDTQLKTNLAIAYHKRGQDSDLEQAAHLYEAVYQSDPEANKPLANDLANVYVTIGDRAYHNKQFDLALSKYQMGSAFAAPENAAPWLGMANTYFIQSQPTQAAECYKKVLEREPKNMMARLYQAKLTLDQGTPQSRESEVALHQIEALRDEYPDNFDVRLVLAEAYQSTGDLVKATEAYNKAAAMQPANSHLWVVQGNLQERLGNLTQAIDAYEHAARLAPENAVIQYNLATVYQQKDQADQAIRSYTAALQLDPKLTDALYGMGLTYERQNRHQEAIESYEKYLSAPGGRYTEAAQERLTNLKAPTTPVQPTPTQQ